MRGRLEGKRKRKRNKEEEGERRDFLYRERKEEDEGGCDLGIAGQAPAAARQPRKTTAPHKQAKGWTGKATKTIVREFLKTISFPYHLFIFFVVVFMYMCLCGAVRCQLLRRTLKPGMRSIGKL